MTDANRILDAADKAASDVYIFDEDVRLVIVAALRELAKRPDDWNRYELDDLADEIEGKNDD